MCAKKTLNNTYNEMEGVTFIHKWKQHPRGGAGRTLVYIKSTSCQLRRLRLSTEVALCRVASFRRDCTAYLVTSCASLQVNSSLSCPVVSFAERPLVLVSTEYTSTCTEQDCLAIRRRGRENLRVLYYGKLILLSLLLVICFDTWKRL